MVQELIRILPSNTSCREQNKVISRESFTSSGDRFESYLSKLLNLCPRIVTQVIHEDIAWRSASTIFDKRRRISKVRWRRYGYRASGSQDQVEEWKRYKDGRLHVRMKHENACTAFGFSYAWVCFRAGHSVAVDWPRTAREQYFFLRSPTL